VRWDVEGAREVYFEGIPVTGHEQRQQCPTLTTTYTLHVVFQDGSAQDYTVTVTVTGEVHLPGQPDLVVTADLPQAVQGQPFTARVTVTNQGTGDAGAFTVRWHFHAATGLADCNWDVNGLRAGQQWNDSCSRTTNAQPGTSPTRLTADVEGEIAESNEGNNEATPTLTVTATAVCTGQPSISTFTASPQSIPAGGSSTLSWAVANAEAVEIDQNIGAVAASGSRQVSPNTNTTFTLTARCGSKSSISKTLVTVTGPTGQPDLVVGGDLPEAVQGQPFTARVTVINQGTGDAGAFTVRWHFHAATGLADCNWDVNGLRAGQQWSNSCSRTTNAQPGTSPTELTADVEREITESNESNNQATPTLTVRGTATCTGAPNIASFSANPSAIASGDSSNLSWGVTNADSIEIDHGVGTVTSPGSKAVRPASTTTYTLTARCGNQSKTKQVTIQVNPAFAVTGVTASADPEFFTGSCPHNVTFSAKITTNGPGTVKYKWIDCDKCPTGETTVVFNSAGSKTVNTGALSYNNQSGVERQTHTAQLQVTSPNPVTSNQAKFTLTCAAPDLVVRNLHVPAQVAHGPHDFEVSWDVYNYGTGQAGASKSRWYTAGGDEKMEWVCSVPALAPGAFYHCGMTFQNVSLTAGKTYGTWAVADSENAVAESKEDNNKSESATVKVIQ
jgi:hypothetical protein